MKEIILLNDFFNNILTTQVHGGLEKVCYTLTDMIITLNLKKENRMQFLNIRRKTTHKNVQLYKTVLNIDINSLIFKAYVTKNGNNIIS